MRPGLLALLALLCPTAALADPSIEEVRVPAGDVVLAGALVLPEGPPRAAVVLIQGAGPHGRNQVISGAPMFAELADALAEAGIARLRIANAGVGSSTGERVAHFREREPHILAAFDYLAARPEVSATPLGLLGHSEGTLVATDLWIERQEAIDFLILLGAPSRPGRIVWVEQQSNPDRFPDRSIEDLEAIRTGFDAVARASIDGDRSAIEAATDALFARIGLTAEELAEARPQFIDRMASPEMQVFLSHDPGPAFARVTDPVLAVWGGIDTLTAPAQNVPVFLDLRNSDSRLTSIVLPDEDHFFLRGEGLPPGQHRRGQMRLSDRLIRTIDFWFSGEDLAQ